MIIKIAKSWLNSVVWFIKNNIRYLASLLQIVLPYLCLYVGEVVYRERGYMAAGGELAVPVIGVSIIYLIREVSNRIGKGSDIPVPYTRFTQVTRDGEVNIDVERLQELTLYMADLEDWMERKNYM